MRIWIIYRVPIIYLGGYDIKVFGYKNRFFLQPNQ